MASTLSCDAYNPGNGFIKNPRSFSASAVPNPAHGGVLKAHDGDDWGTGRKIGVDIQAAADGVVVINTENRLGYGNYLVLEHTRDDGSKFRTLYAHMAEASPYKVGDTVSAGKTIGEAGTTGGSTGIHLHFEVIDGGGKNLPASHTNRLDPASFDNWGNLPHMAGTDASGNALIAHSTGSVQNGDYSRIIQVTDKTTGAVLDSYGQTFTALKNGAGETTAFRIINKNAAGQDIVIDTVTPEGESLRREILTPTGQTYYVNQAGIDVYTTADGSRQAYIPGVDGPIAVAADGSLSLSTNNGNISFQLSDNPLLGGTCTAGQQTYQLKPGEGVEKCFDGITIRGQASDGKVTDTLIDGKGQRIELQYETDSFEFGSLDDAGWRLAKVEPILLADAGGTVTDAPQGLFAYKTGDLEISGDSTGTYRMNFANDEGGSTLVEHQNDVATGWTDTVTHTDSLGAKSVATTVDEGITTTSTYTPTGTLEQTSTTYYDLDAYGNDYGLTLTRAAGSSQIGSCTVSNADGTSALDWTNLSAYERGTYGLYTENEVGSRLSQLGLADAASFNNTGFSGTDSANAGLNSYQYSAAGQDYYFVNSFADFTLSDTAAWNGLGSGLNFTDGGNFTCSATAVVTIDYMDGATNWVSPLILDLDGDGVAADLTHAYGERVYFDIDADGAAERVGWLNGDDALLAVDSNGNGRIDDITELFGDDQMPAFQKLSKWDSNQDGKVDASDTHYSQLKLWRDTNRDGVSQAGELTGLEIAGVHFMSDNLDTWKLGAQSQVYGAKTKLNLEALMLPLSRGYGTLASSPVMLARRGGSDTLTHPVHSANNGVWRIAA